MKASNLAILIIVILIIIVLIVGFIPKTEKGTIKIGAIYPLTGSASFLGEGNNIGATIAVDLINKNGGINGRELTLVVEDSQTSPKTAVNAFSKLIEIDGVNVILTTLSNVGIAIRPLAQEKEIVILAESSHPELTKNYSYIFRNFYTVENGANSLVPFIKENGIEKIAILYINDDFGNSALSDLEKRSKDSNFIIVTKESFEGNQQDFKTSLLKIKQNNPNLVYIVGFGNSVVIAYNQARELELNSTLVGFIICGQGNIIEAAKEALNMTYSIEPSFDKNSEEYQGLLSEYKERYPNRIIDQEVIVAYDAVNIIAEAIKDGANTGAEIRDYLLSKKIFHGASGTIEFDSEGDSKRAMEVSKIINGKCIKYEKI